MAGASGASSLVEESEHDKKYDRQMRLWGSHGQKRLQTSHICVLHSGPTSAETLKNLVLPCIGAFTLVDDAIVTEEDCGNNFFVDTQHIGRSRAETVAELLLELNPEVRGTALVKNPRQLIEEDLTFFSQFQLVVVSQLPTSTCLLLSEYCYEKAIPLLILRSYGLLASARVVIKEHTVIESHPDNDRYDLYIHPKQLQHFPALKQYIDSFGDLAAIPDSMEHAHVPYLVILATEMEKWTKAHNGAGPTGWSEQQKFKEQIKNASAAYGDTSKIEENFEEAIQFAYRVYSQPELDSMVAAVYEDRMALTSSLTKTSSPFWILVNAVNSFVAAEGKGLLPVSTNLPDMASTSASYIRLKEVFAERAMQDTAAVRRHLNALLSSLDLPPSHISENEVAFFVANSRNLRCVRMRSLVEEYTTETFNSGEVNELFQDASYNVKPIGEGEDDEGAPINPHNLHWYFALRAADEFRAREKRYPGTGETDADYMQDAKQMEMLQDQLFEAVKIDTSISTAIIVPQCLQEVARYGATEIHNTAAFIGGLGAQISLKILLQQYIPLNNTYIYNGIHGSGGTFTL